VKTTTVDLSEYSSQLVAVDASLYLYKSKASASGRFERDDWVTNLVYFICTLRKNNIHPVFVYDSKAPVAKAIEHRRRAEKREMHAKRIQAFESALERYETEGVIEEILSEFIINTGSRLLRGGETSQPKLDVDAVRDKIERMKATVVQVFEADFEVSREICRLFGIPYIHAPGEAEAMCCYLGIKGYVHAILTDDSDVLAYGAPRFISKLNGAKNTVEEILYENVLSDLELDSSSFLDLCIMCGTDYNENMRGIGPSKSYSLIKQYRTIDQIGEVIDCSTGEKKYDITPLNHVLCRDMFKIPDEIKVDLKYCDSPNIDAFDECERRYNIRVGIPYIKSCFKPLSIVFESD
jgi:5'-3' exonuclease